MNQVLTIKENNKVAVFGTIEKIETTNEGNEDAIVDYKVFVGERTYIMSNPYRYDFHEVEELPEGLQIFTWGYTKERGFYKDDDLKKCNVPKSETEILKERLAKQEQTLAKQEQTLAEQEQVLAEQDELLAMLLLGE